MNYAQNAIAGAGIVGAASLGGPLADSPRQPQAQGSMNVLINTMEDTERYVEQLTQRLGAVLRPTPPTPGNPRTESVREVKAPFAESIDQVSARLRLINEALCDLGQRLEV